MEDIKKGFTFKELNSMVKKSYEFCLILARSGRPDLFAAKIDGTHVNIKKYEIHGCSEKNGCIKIVFHIMCRHKDNKFILKPFLMKADRMMSDSSKMIFINSLNAPKIKETNQLKMKY